MDWLKQLLAGLGAGIQPQTTPPFNPYPGAQSAAPQIQRQVPTPAPITPPVAAPAPIPTAVGTTMVRPGYDQVGAPTEAPKVLSRREELEQDFSQTAAAPAEKQNKWLQGLFLAAQAGQRIADPTNIAGAYDPKQPIQWLGNAKKQADLQRIQGELAPIYAQDQQRAGSLKAGIELEKELANLTKTRAEAAQIGKTKPETREFGGRVYTTTDGGVTWRDAQGIVAPPIVKRQLEGGETVELNARDVYTQEKQDKRNTETAEATRAAKEVEREIDATRYAVDDQARFETEQAEFQNKRAAVITEGEELQNQAGVLESQARDLEAKGGASEAAKLREEAAKLRAQGRAKIRQGNEMKPPRTKPKSYTVPKTPKSGRVSRSKDPLGLFQ